MKFESVDADDPKQIAALVKDPHWVFEQKMDGTRGMAVITDSRPVWWPGRGGRGALAHTAATQHLPHINAALSRIVGQTPGEVVFDGEIMTETGEFHVFDCPYMRFGGVEVIQPTDAFWRRRTALDAPDLAGLLTDSPVKVVAQARTAREKQTLIERVFERGGEGVMAKDTRASYTPGSRTSSAVKIKFVKTADVVVIAQTRTPTNSIELGVVATPPSASSPRRVNVGGLWLQKVGACSGIGRPDLESGQVIEIKYLYWTGGSVYQPRFTRIRTDKAPDECFIDQFRPYSRRAVSFDAEGE